MALRYDSLRIGRLARLATAALISASTFCLAGAPAQAHYYRHYRHYAHTTHQAHYPRYTRAAHYWRPAHYGHRAYPHYAAVTAGAGSRLPALSAIVVRAHTGGAP